MNANARERERKREREMCMWMYKFGGERKDLAEAKCPFQSLKPSQGRTRTKDAFSSLVVPFGGEGGGVGNIRHLLYPVI